MSTSLMDILSCGLAAVIILMIIALSSSKLQQEDLLSATYYEFQLHYEGEISSYKLKIKNSAIGDTVGTLIPVGEYEPVLQYYIDLPTHFDSTLDLRVYQPRPYINISKNETHRCQDFSVVVKPEAGEFQMEFELNNLPYPQDSTYFIDYKIVSNFNSIPETFERSDSLRGRNTLVLEYKLSPEIRIRQQ